MNFGLISSFLILNNVYQVRSECVLNINDIQAQMKTGDGNVDDKEKGNLMLEVLGSDHDVRIFNTIPTDKADAEIFRSGKDKDEDKEKQNRTHDSPYDFDDSICKIVGNRLLCGYNKNTGDIPDPKQVIDLGDGCVIRKNRIECNYTSGTNVGIDTGKAGGRQADITSPDNESQTNLETNSKHVILRTESHTSTNTQQSTNTHITQKTTTQVDDLTATPIPASFETTTNTNNNFNIIKENKTKNVTTFKIKIRKNVSCDVKSFVSKLMALLKSGKIAGYSNIKNVLESTNTFVTNSSTIKTVASGNNRKHINTTKSDMDVNNTTYTISIKQLREFIYERSKTKIAKDNKTQNSITIEPISANKSGTKVTMEQITETIAKNEEKTATTKQMIQTTTCPTCPFKKTGEHSSNLNIFNILRDVTKQPVKAVTICVDKQDYIYCYDRSNLEQ